MPFVEVGELASWVRRVMEKAESELVVLVEGPMAAVESNVELKQMEEPDHTMA